MNEMKQKRILLVDDNAAIHEDFCKILSKNADHSLDEDESIIFGTKKTPENYKKTQEYRIDSAYQGIEALELVRQSLLIGQPYALAFIDMRMPPGWDGVETIKRIWQVDPYIQMVICSAFSDHSWEEITRELGNSDNLLILKKPFEPIEINQMASAMTIKWELIANLQGLVKIRTAELENLYSLTNTTLEATQEGIIAVGLDGYIVKYNTNFCKQWNISETLLQSKKSSVVFEKLAEQVEDSPFFLKMMNDLVTTPQTNSIKEWVLKTGAVLELYTHPQFLHDEIIGIVYSFREITERKDLEKQLLHQATHDSLTGLPNRALLMDRINQALAHAKRFNRKVGVLLLDLDSFKEVNDTFGHKAGDMLLKCHATRLASYLREIDTAARLGGDEFVVILADQSDEKNLVEVLHKLVELFLKPCLLGDQELIITASIGVSIYPQDGRDADTLLKNADAALYYAKKQGQNKFQFYLAEFNKQILQRAELKVALGQALQKKELSLCYQPLVDLKSNKIIGLEALLRWKHPTMGFISPLVFIPIAEESGLILSIGEWVLRTACAQTKIWFESSAYSDLKISINISVNQFKQRDFTALIQGILEETQLMPQCLELEITESLLLGNISEIIQKMFELKKLGVRFAIDDFGTGYSTLSYLKYFPFDTVKIDKTFMDNISTDPNNASIVEAIIGMTKSMGMDVLAEGVEHEDQIAFLRKFHGDQVQGYYFSKPLTEQDCTKLLMKK